MTGGMRPVTGSIKVLSCKTCGSRFSLFDFEVEGDIETVGLGSAGVCNEDRVLLMEMTLDEWNDAQSGKLRTIPPRLEGETGGHSYRITHILRVEKPALPSAGLSFMTWRKQFEAPTVVYACPCCEDGEATVASELTVEEYRRSGGTVSAIPPLAV